MFDSLKFWKKNDDMADLSDIKLDMGSEMSAQPDMGAGQPPQDPFSQQQQTPGFNQQQPQPEFGSQPPQQNFDVQPVQGTTNFAGGAGGGDMQKDLEIISAKLDALKSSLESINQRLSNIERLAQQGEKPQQKKTWY